MQPERNLGSSSAMVWLLDVSALSSADWGRSAAILSAEENERASRFHFQADREAYAAAHMLVRLALSYVEPYITPSDWTFEIAQGGRPEIGGGIEAAASLRFNLSHTRGMVACVVTRGMDCGIDVEPIQRFGRMDEVAQHVCGPSEKAHLASLHGEDKQLLLARFWTLKEAYAKALGLGLAMPFETTEFQCTETGASLLGGDAGWTFDQRPCGQGFLAAVALRGAARPVYLSGLPAWSSPLPSHAAQSS